MDLEEYEHGHQLSHQSEKRRLRARSFDSSSVKEVDPAAHFQHVRLDSADQQFRSPEDPSAVAQLQSMQLITTGVADRETMEPPNSSELEDLLKAGRDELLMTSTLSLRHLSNEKIVSLMQLILESGANSPGSPEGYPKLPPKLTYSQSSCGPQLPNFTPGLGLFHNLISRVKTFVSIHLMTTSRSQLFKVLTMNSSTRGASPAMRMSEAVAGVLEEGYLPELQHLSLPPCDIATIVRALICGRISTLQHLELQGDLDSWHYSKSRLLRRLFMSGLLDRLQYLRLSRCGKAEEMDAVATAIGAGRIPILIHLDLSFNLLQGDSGSNFLANLMRCRALVCLEHLNLQNCGINDEGVQVLASSIKARGRWKLKYLNLGSNEIGDTGFRALLTVLKADQLPWLQELHFLYNYRVGEESKMEVASILEEGHVPVLQVFYLSSHSITERVAEAFLAAFKNNTALTVDLLGIWWPNERIEREAADYRERNLGFVSRTRKKLDFEFQPVATDS